MATLTDQDEREQFSAMIARMNAETRKFVEEQLKLGAERDKLAAEALKFNRERLYAPVLAAAAVAGAVAGVVATLGRLF